MAGNTNEALIRAAVNGSLEGVKAALEAGADVTFCKPFTQDQPVGTALYIAACVGHVDVVKLLLRKGASLVKRETVYGFTPLHGAAVNGTTEVVEVLVHHGATVDVPDGLFRMTPLAYACNYGHVDTVRRLIQFGARVDSAMEYCGEVPGKRPRDMRKEECLKMMIQAMETKQLKCCNPKCNKPGSKSELPKCGACKLVRYCSRECQRQHWSGGHKNCCGRDDVQWP